LCATLVCGVEPGGDTLAETEESPGPTDQAPAAPLTLTQPEVGPGPTRATTTSLLAHCLPVHTRRIRLYSCAWHGILTARS